MRWNVSEARARFVHNTDTRYIPEWQRKVTAYSVVHFSCVTCSVISDALNVRLLFFSVVQCFLTCIKGFPVSQTLVRAVSFEQAVANSYEGVNI